MSGSDWLRYTAAVAAALALIVFGWTIATLVAGGDPYGCRDTNNKQTEAQGYKLPRTRVVPNFDGTVYHTPNCHRPKSRDEDDLCQQMRMAEAAEEASCITYVQSWVNVLGLMTLLLAVYFAARAAKYAKSAADAANDMNQITGRALIAQQRAWLKITNVEAHLVAHDKFNVGLKVVIITENTGNNPALEVFAFGDDVEQPDVNNKNVYIAKFKDHRDKHLMMKRYGKTTFPGDPTEHHYVQAADPDWFTSTGSVFGLAVSVTYLPFDAAPIAQTAVARLAPLAGRSYQIFFERSKTTRNGESMEKLVLVDLDRINLTT